MREKIDNNEFSWLPAAPPQPPMPFTFPRLLLISVPYALFTLCLNRPSYQCLNLLKQYTCLCSVFAVEQL